MLIKNLEKLRKKTLRGRSYEEVVRLIASGELRSGGWVDEKQVIDKLRVSRTPFRKAIRILAKGGLVEIQPYRGFYVRSFSRNETADLYELYKRLERFAVEAAIRMANYSNRQFGRPMRRNRSLNRGSERRGSKNGRSRMDGLNRAS